jgi:hypothetical protein
VETYRIQAMNCDLCGKPWFGHTTACSPTSAGYPDGLPGGSSSQLPASVPSVPVKAVVPIVERITDSHAELKTACWDLLSLVKGSGLWDSEYFKTNAPCLYRIAELIDFHQ